jgi:hypothetical protein
MERRQRTRSLIHHQIGTQTCHALRAAQLADQQQQAFSDSDLRQQPLRVQHLLTKGGLLIAPGTAKALRISFPRQASPDDLSAQPWLLWRAYLHHHAEAIEQLWP